MALTEEHATWFAKTFTMIVENVAKALLGKEEVIRLALTAMLAEGHLLLEDAPGTGKTALARALAASVQGTHSRIQFTPDPSSPPWFWPMRSTGPVPRPSRRCWRSWRSPR